MENLKTQLLKAIENATTNELIELNNAYCYHCNYQDSEIYSNDEDFFEMFFPNAGDGLRVAQAVHFGDYKYNHDYVRFNGYGNLESLNFMETKDLCELPEVIVDYILEDITDFEDLDIFNDVDFTLND
jgi:hypothetical protein